MCWGTLGDRVGRRPIFLACLLVLSLSCVGLALVPTSAYWLLMLLRCLQAAGSASTIALGNETLNHIAGALTWFLSYNLGAGVIGDISTASERGGYFGVYSLGPMVSHSRSKSWTTCESNFYGYRSGWALHRPSDRWHSSRQSRLEVSCWSAPVYLVVFITVTIIHFRSIFWFLCIGSALCSVFMLL